MKRLFLLLLPLLLLSACQAQHAFVKPTLDADGEVYLYVRPFPREAERLKFGVAEISAVKDDGTQYPLGISLREFSGATLKRQRFFAGGQLPPGQYTGFSLKIDGATYRDDEAEQRLLVPDGAARVDFPFTVERRGAAMISLSLDYGRSVRDTFSFSPVFSVYTPKKPVIGLVGYVTNPAMNLITVLDKQYNEVVGVIATGAGPRGLAFDQQRRRAYVGLSGEDAVEVFDMMHGEKITRIPLKPGDRPQEVALTPDGKVLLAANAGSDTVSVVDTQSYTESTRIRVGNNPTSIVIDPAGLRAYVFNSYSQDISVIDIGSRSIAATAASEPGETRGQFNRKGDILYTIHDQGSYLRVLSAYSLGVQQRYRVGMGMISLKSDPLTSLLYVGKKFDGDIDVYEPSTFIAIASIPVGGEAAYMTIDGEGNNLYVVNTVAKTVQVVNLITREVVAEIDAGDDPARICLMGER